MSKQTYELAGQAHTKKDEEVPFSEVVRTQKELNGNVSMLLKIFKVGKNWQHEDRMRETMLNNSLALCPMYLLFKDHKGWDIKKGPVPPTRPVASGNRGMNIHLSEIVSEILEPVADSYKGSHEVISTEDLIAQLLKVDKSLEGWSKLNWWEGVEYENYVTCGKCPGSVLYKYDETNPELCNCEQVVRGSLRGEVETGPLKLTTENEYTTDSTDGDTTSLITGKLQQVQISGEQEYLEDSIDGNTTSTITRKLQQVQIRGNMKASEAP